MVTGVRAKHRAFGPLCPGRQLGSLLHGYTSCISSRPANGHSISHFSPGALHSRAVCLESSCNLNLFSERKKEGEREREREREREGEREREKQICIVWRSESSRNFNLFLEQILAFELGMELG